MVGGNWVATESAFSMLCRCSEVFVSVHVGGYRIDSS